jgi:hypothetical protein
MTCLRTRTCSSVSSLLNNRDTKRKAITKLAKCIRMESKAIHDSLSLASICDPAIKYILIQDANISATAAAAARRRRYFFLECIHHRRKIAADIDSKKRVVGVCKLQSVHFRPSPLRSVTVRGRLILVLIVSSSGLHCQQSRDQSRRAGCEGQPLDRELVCASWAEAKFSRFRAPLTQGSRKTPTLRQRPRNPI